MLDQRPSARHAFRILSHENTDCILRLPDLPLEVGDLSVGRVEHLLRLKHIELRSYSVVESQLGQLDRLFLGFDRVFGDLELEVKPEELEVVARHVTHQRQDHRLLGLLSG